MLGIADMMLFWTFPFFVVPLIILSILGMIIWVWALVDCIKRDISPSEKIIWILLMIFLSLIGALLYLFIGRNSNMKSSKQKKSSKRLTRSEDKIIAGVCAGIAEHVSLDPTLVRLLWVLITIFTGFWGGILAYIIAWIIIPSSKKK